MAAVIQGTMYNSMILRTMCDRRRGTLQDVAREIETQVGSCHDATTRSRQATCVCLNFREVRARSRFRGNTCFSTFQSCLPRSRDFLTLSLCLYFVPMPHSQREGEWTTTDTTFRRLLSRANRNDRDDSRI